LYAGCTPRLFQYRFCHQNTKRFDNPSYPSPPARLGNRLLGCSGVGYSFTPQFTLISPPSLRSRSADHAFPSWTHLSIGLSFFIHSWRSSLNLCILAICSYLGHYTFHSRFGRWVPKNPSPTVFSPVPRRPFGRPSWRESCSFCNPTRFDEPLAEHSVFAV